MPRYISAGGAQPLAGGVAISCETPCASTDDFAIDDLKAALAAQGVAVNPSSAVEILVTRYGTPAANSIYSEAAAIVPAAQGAVPTQQGAVPAPSASPNGMPDQMRPEGYAIVPRGSGLALAAATDSGIFYALRR